MSLYDEDVPFPGDGESFVDQCGSAAVPLVRPRLSCEREQKLSCGISLSTRCAATSVAQMLPSPSRRNAVRPRNGCREANERAVLVEFENGWAPRVSTRRCPLAANARLADAPIWGTAGSGSGSAPRVAQFGRRVDEQGGSDGRGAIAVAPARNITNPTDRRFIQSLALACRSYAPPAGVQSQSAGGLEETIGN